MCLHHNLKYFNTLVFVALFMFYKYSQTVCTVQFSMIILKFESWKPWDWWLGATHQFWNYILIIISYKELKFKRLTKDDSTTFRLLFDSILKNPSVHVIDTNSWHFPPDRNSVIRSSGNISANAEKGGLLFKIVHE